MFWPKSSTCRVVSSGRTSTGGSSSIRRTGGEGDALKRVLSCVTTRTGDQASSSPSAPVDQPARSRRRSITTPCIRSAPSIAPVAAVHSAPDAITTSRLFRRCDLELNEQGKAVTKLVEVAKGAHLSAEPPVRENGSDHVGTRLQEVRYVIGLNMQVPGVGGAAGRQFGIADANSIEKELIETVRGRVETRRQSGFVDHETVGGEATADGGREVRGSSASGGSIHSATQSAGIEQAHLPCNRFRPFALTRVGPHFDGAVDPLARSHRRTGKLDEHRLAAFDAA